MAVGVPCAVLLDGQRADSDGLRRVPGNQPKSGVRATGEVQPASAALPLCLGKQARHTIADNVCGAHGIIRALDVCGPLCGGSLNSAQSVRLLTRSSMLILLLAWVAETALLIFT